MVTFSCNSFLTLPSSANIITLLTLFQFTKFPITTVYEVVFGVVHVRILSQF